MSRGRYYGHRPLEPRDRPGVKRDIANAQRRGDTKTAARLSKRLLCLQQQLFGPAGEPEPGKPFNDEIDFIGR